MKCFPAIDIRQGQAVRLYQGDYDQMTVYHHSPLEVAKEFASKGATHLHLVDLDGAKNGELVNLEVIGQILEAVPLFLQVGGGIRDMERIKAYLDNGVHRVILGTAAVEDPEFLERAVHTYGPRIAVGVDVKNGQVAIRGWQVLSPWQGDDFIDHLVGLGVTTVIYTDISKDGKEEGTNLEAYERLVQKDLNIVASGGITHLHELTQLQDMGIYGAILGKALYTGKIKLEEALALLSQ